MRWNVLLGLVLCNVVWAMNPFMGKIVLAEIAPLQLAWWRYASATIAFFLYAIFRLRPLNPTAIERKKFPWFLTMGAITFFLSPFFQYQGLALSSSTANALIIAIEPLFAALLAWAILQEKINPLQWICFLLAIIGFCLLSDLNLSSLEIGVSSVTIGNLLILAALPAEGMFSIVSRKLIHTISGVRIMLFALPIGLALLTIANFNMGVKWMAPQSWQAWFAIFWLGPIGTTLAYLYWAIALREATVAAASITLFVQPLLGAFCGMFFLGDRLSAWQLLGSGIILIALVLETTLQWQATKNT